MIKNLSEVEGYEEYDDYSITSDGEVVSHYKEEDLILKPNCDRNGYLYVGLYANKKCKTTHIAPLVAKAFCKGYKEDLEIDHINEIKIDNSASNLQYLTHIKNVQKSKNIPVVQLTLKGELVKIWKSATEARKAEKFDNGSISKVCKGKLKTHAGYNWCFEKDLKSNIGKKTIGCKRKVAQLDKENNIIKIWESETEAKKVGGFNQGNISRACLGKLKTSAGYKWKFI